MRHPSDEVEVDVEDASNDDAAPKKGTVPSTTTPTTAKFSNSSSRLIGKLLKRHQSRKFRQLPGQVDQEQRTGEEQQDVQDNAAIEPKEKRDHIQIRHQFAKVLSATSPRPTIEVEMQPPPPKVPNPSTTKIKETKHREEPPEELPDSYQ